jgi:hypothetical protein
LAEQIGLKDEYFDAIMSSYDFAMLCTITESVFSKTLNADATAKLIKLIKKCRDLNIDRVRVAHGLWVVSQDGGRVHHVPRGSLQPKWHLEQAERLQKLADIACNLRAELEKIVYAEPKDLFRHRIQVD